MKTSRIQLLKLAKNGHHIILNDEDVVRRKNTGWRVWI